MRTIKTLIYFLFAPIMFPMMIFLHLTFGKTDAQDRGWFQNIWFKKGNYFEKFIGVLVSPVYFVVYNVLHYFQEPWQKLMEK